MLDKLATLFNHLWIGLLGLSIAIPLSARLLKTRKEWVGLWTSFFIMQGIVWSIKYLVNRLRPIGNHVLTNPSFPSGVAADAGFLAMYLTLIYPKYWPLWQTLGIGMSLLRVYNGAHYWSDIVVGYLLGSLIILIAHRWAIFQTPSRKPLLNDQ